MTLSLALQSSFLTYVLFATHLAALLVLIGVQCNYGAMQEGGRKELGKCLFCSKGKP